MRDETRDEGGSEAELVRRARDDPAALAALFTRHRERLWRTVRARLDRRLLGRVDPDDVLQEAYLDAAKRVGHFDREGGASFFIWLRLIVGQTLVDVHRRHLGARARDAGREVGLDGGRTGPDPGSAAVAAELSAHLTPPSHAARRAEAAAILEAALDGMEPIDREVLVLRHFEELSNSEVAEVLGIQPKAASIRYVRALARLKAVLGKIPGFGETD